MEDQLLNAAIIYVLFLILAMTVMNLFLVLHLRVVKDEGFVKDKGFVKELHEIEKGCSTWVPP